MIRDPLEVPELRYGEFIGEGRAKVLPLQADFHRRSCWVKEGWCYARDQAIRIATLLAAQHHPKLSCRLPAPRCMHRLQGKQHSHPACKQPL